MTNIEILEEEIEQTKNEEFQQKLAEKKYKNLLEKKLQMENDAEKKRLKKIKYQQLMQKNFNLGSASNADMSQSGIEQTQTNL